MNRKFILLMTVLLGFALGVAAQNANPSPVQWKDCMSQSRQWYATQDAERIADNLLLYQRESGGWPKNIDMAAVLAEKDRAEIARLKSNDDSTIDNDSTYVQIAYLARVFNATGRERFKSAAIKGVDYLLKAQYPNGGWPQYFPKLEGYYKRITFNDNAMIGVMTLLREIARNGSDYGFVDDPRRARADEAVRKGVEVILKTQIVVDGRKTVWCAQHDEATLEPAPARSYEKISLSGSESAGIVRFLMELENPDARVIEAVRSAVDWFERSRLSGVKVMRKSDPSMPNGFDVVVVRDEHAPPLWARFYEIGSNRPIFCGRDGIIKYSLAEIEHERRTGYGWYSNAPARLLAEDYPAWIAKREEGQSYLLFTSFRGNGEDGLHLSISRDGYNWRSLNDDKPFLKPSVGNGKLMRDPSLAQAPDGAFHMVWTTGWWDRTIGYASSKDLINWSEQTAIPVMAHEPAARNAWAPELFYDDVKKQWLIFWASTIPGRFPGAETTGPDEKNHRIYYVTTNDFKNFSETRLFFDPGFNVIDAIIVKSGAKYYLIFKDEREKPVKKNLRMAVSDKAEGPYGSVSEPFTRDWVEGPSAIRIDDRWFIYFDQYRDHRYGAVKTRDFNRWEDISAALTFPKDHRHGTVLRISNEIAAQLKAAKHESSH